MNTIFRGLRRHIHFFVIVPILIIAMTWPAFVYVFETETFWLAGQDNDAYMLFWDAWYAKFLATGHANYFYTEFLFHPHGGSLAFHNFSLPHMALFAGLQLYIPAPNAYNLTYLVLVSLTVFSSYIYLNYLFRDKWLAFFGATVFGTCALVLAAPSTPSVAFLATLPLSMYVIHRAVSEQYHPYFLLGGVLVGVTAFSGMYPLVCLLITLLFYVPYLAFSKWKDVKFWTGIALTLSVAATLVSVRVYPMIADSEGLTDALSKSESREYGTELLGYFINYGHPITKPILESAFNASGEVNGEPKALYLGYVPLVLGALGVATYQRRGTILLWMILFCLFAVLRLGSSLTIDGLRYEHIVLPKHFLTELLPYVFKPFWNAGFFQIGIVLPLAVLACYGMMRCLRWIPRKHHRSFVLILAGVVAFEHYREPTPIILPDERFDFIRWLRLEPEQETIHLINLPMGGQQSKVYGLYQTLSGYPHVEGRPTRTPSAAFRYIDSNFLLSTWRRGESVQCFPGLRDEYLSDLNRLVNDGFTHVLVHHQLAKNSATIYSFLNVPTAYEDKHLTIYRLEDLRKNCEGSLLLLPETARQLNNALRASAIIPEKGLSILWVHPPLSDSGTVEFEFTATLYSLEHTFRLAKRDSGGFRAHESDGPLSDVDGLLNWRSMILLSYDPSLTDRALLDSYEAWVEGNFKTCGRIQESEHSVIEYFVKPIFPCSLVIRGDAAPIEYDNGMKLGHLVHEFVDEKLDTYMLWSRLLFERHSVSIQIFDKDNVKVLGDDFVISHAPLAYHRIDLSSLLSRRVRREDDSVQLRNPCQRAGYRDQQRHAI